MRRAREQPHPGIPPAGGAGFPQPKASLLAFVDPSLSLPPILASRFPVHLELAGIDRMRQLPDGQSVPTLALVTLASERRRCEGFDPANLFKHVSGFNPVQYRDAMRFVDATARGKVPPGALISALQTFKKGGGQDVQLPDKTFADIGGYRNLVARLKQIAQLMAGERLAGVPEALRRQLLPQGLLLHGQPGTGKTLLAKALAKEMNATIQIVSGPEVMDMYVGESERKIRNLFSTARRNAPSVIIFDEFDAIATQRTDQPGGGNRAGNAVVAQLLTELDGFHEGSDVLVVATTNRIDIIDEALLRPSRFLPIEVPLPDQAARLAIAKLHAGNYGVDRHLPGAALRLVGEYSEGLNGDEIRAVFQEAATAHYLESRPLDLPLLGSFVGRMRERREQRRRRHLGIDDASATRVGRAGRCGVPAGGRSAFVRPGAVRSDTFSARRGALIDMYKLSPEHEAQLDTLWTVVRGQLRQAFVAKTEIIDLLVVCVVAGEHLLLLGPPGTAKTALVQRFVNLIDADCFEYLLTKFTEPNELFGPVDIELLTEKKRYRRLTEGMLPDANMIFLDEIFKANSAILNTLLTVMNERVFYNGSDNGAPGLHAHPLPVLSVFGASNELPDDTELQALVDRFAVRALTGNVPEEHTRAMLDKGWMLERERARFQDKRF